jgi:hypothetical protein
MVALRRWSVIMGIEGGALGLSAVRIPRTTQRMVDQRSEERHEGLVESAIVRFRGEQHQVEVINISSRGAMIECALLPRIGENLIIMFDRCTPVHAFVRWIRDGRLGLSFGHEILLEPEGTLRA